MRTYQFILPLDIFRLVKSKRVQTIDASMNIIDVQCENTDAYLMVGPTSLARQACRSGTIDLVHRTLNVIEQSSYGRYDSRFEYGYDLRSAPSIRYPSPQTFERLSPSTAADVMTSSEMTEQTVSDERRSISYIHRLVRSHLVDCRGRTNCWRLPARQRSSRAARAVKHNGSAFT